MGFFDNLNVENAEKETDSLGGFQTLTSDIYPAEIRMAYAHKSASGAKGVVLDLLLKKQDGTDYEYRHTIYFTNKQGQATYERNGKQYTIPGYNILNALANHLAGKPLAGLNMDMRTLAIYDATAGKEVPKEVPVLTDLIGAKFSVALLQKRENASKKDATGEYVKTSQERFTNEIDKVLFSKEGKLYTHLELETKQSKPEFEPEFADKWLEKNQYKLRDNYEKVEESGSTDSGSTNSSVLYG